MKMTLLQMVQSILEQSDTEFVNSINDSIEAIQCAGVIRDIYFANVATKRYKELEGLIQLESLADNDYPNYLKLPDGVTSLKWVHYNKSLDGGQEYKPITFVKPEDFLRKTSTADDGSSRVDIIFERQSGTPLLIYNDVMPDFYTTFDDEYLVFNSYNSSVENTLQGSKSRSMAKSLPTWTMADDFIPHLNTYEFPHLLAESKSTFMSLFKNVVDPKIEQLARRQKNFRQDENRLEENYRAAPHYGR
jgi:hypothetical protein